MNTIAVLTFKIQIVMNERCQNFNNQFLKCHSLSLGCSSFYYDNKKIDYIN